MPIRDIGVRTVVENLGGFLSGMSQYNAKLTEAQQKTIQFSQRAGQTGRALGALSAPLIGIGFLAARTFGEFEQSMAKVEAVSGATADQMEELERVARRMGETTVFTAREAAGALSFMAMAGLSVEDMITALPSVLNLAASGQLDLATSADIVTNILAGQRMEADDLAFAVDVLVKSFTSANTNLVQLGSAFKFAGPVAAAAGVQFSEQAAILGLLGDAGIQASLAGTSLRGAVSRLLSPSREASDILARMGVSVTDSSGQLRSFADIIDDLSAGGAQAADIMTIFGLRAGPAMLQLLAVGGDAIRDFSQELEVAGGVAQRVRETQLDTMIGDLTLTASAAEGAQISIGEGLAPAIRLLSHVVIPVLNTIGRLAERFPVLTAVIIGAGVVIGGLATVLIALGFIMPGLVILFPALAYGISLAAIASGALAIALSPITLIVLGIVAAVGAAIFIWRHWGDIVEWVGNLLANVVDKLKTVANFILRVNPIGLIASAFGQEVPQFAHGGTMGRTGAAIVGEFGPAVMQLPAGAQVTPSTSYTSNYNVQANYTNPQTPQALRHDLEAITMMARA